MDPVPLGQPVRLSFTVKQRNADGTESPVDAGTISLKTYLYGTLVQTYTPSHDGAAGSGLYHQDVPAADLVTASTYTWVLITTGAGAGSSTGTFDVYDPLAVPPPPLTVEEFRTLTGSDTDAVPDGQARMRIDGVTADVRRIAGWSISRETARTWTLDGTGSTDLFLPTLRLTAVSSVTDDGTLLAASAYEWNEVGVITRTDGGRFTRKLRGVVVIGTHGYTSEELADLKGTIAEHVLRRVSYPAGVVASIRIDDYAETLSSGAAVVPLEEDPRVLRYRLSA